MSPSCRSYPASVKIYSWIAIMDPRPSLEHKHKAALLDHQPNSGGL